MIKELVLSTLKEVNEDSDDRGFFKVKELFSMEDDGLKLGLQVTITRTNGVEQKVTTKYVPKKIEELESGIEALYSDVLVELLKLLL